MRLQSDPKYAFELEVLGYEFPQLEVDPHGYDLNFLVVRVRVDTPERTWSAEHPSLLTWELMVLRDWLRAHANLNMEAEPSIWFVEPNLRFELNHHNDRLALAIVLDQEFACDGEGKPTGSSTTLRMLVTPAQTQEAAQALDQYLTRFPERRPKTLN